MERLLVALAPGNLPRLDQISIDGGVLAFTFGTSLAAGLLFGSIPIVKYARPGLALSLRGGGRNASQSRERHRARSILVMRFPGGILRPLDRANTARIRALSEWRVIRSRSAVAGLRSHFSE